VQGSVCGTGVIPGVLQNIGAWAPRTIQVTSSFLHMCISRVIVRVQAPCSPTSPRNPFCVIFKSPFLVGGKVHTGAHLGYYKPINYIIWPKAPFTTISGYKDSNMNSYRVTSATNMFGERSYNFEPKRINVLRSV
jgi:hypothetical protein